MAETITINQPHLLIVEGQENVDFFRKLRQHLGITSIQLHKVDGSTVEKIEAGLGASMNTAGFGGVTRIGFVRDDLPDAYFSWFSCGRWAVYTHKQSPLICCAPNTHLWYDLAR